MKDSIVLSGVVLSSAPVGENDKRMVLLTRENGRVTVFATGCRKSTSPLLAFTRPFTYARFTVYPGRDAYHLQSAEMIESFDGLASDFDAVAYGTYFLELAGYFSQENADAAEELDLLFVTIRAVLKKKMSMKLIRAVYEFRMLRLQGIAPDVFRCCSCSGQLKEGYFLIGRHGVGCRKCFTKDVSRYYLNETALYTLKFIETEKVSRLYSFNLPTEDENCVCAVVKQYYRQHIGGHFKSLELITD